MRTRSAITVGFHQTGCSLGIVLIWLCLLLLHCQLAQAAPPRTLRFEPLTVDASLTSETVQAIVQDKHGFIWIATDGGLRRFDGYHIIHYKSQANNPNALADQWVQSLLIDSDGTLWVGTQRGLHRYNPNTDNFTRFIPQDPRARGKEHLHISAMLNDGKRGIWLATQDGLQHFNIDSQKFLIYRNEPNNFNSLANNQVNALSKDAAGNLWIGTANGLDRLHSNQRFEHFLLSRPNEKDSKRNAVQTLWLDKAQSLWIGTIGGLEAWRLDKGEPVRRRFGPDDGLARGWVTSLFQDSDSNLWVGTFEGLHLWDANSGRFLVFRHQPDDPLTLGDNRISAQFQDRSGSMWVGTWFSGLARIDLASGGFSNYTKSQFDKRSISDNTVNAIIGDHNQLVWLATNDGLNRLDPKTGEFTAFRFPQTANKTTDNANQINDVVIDGKERMWVATPNGIFPFNSQKLEFGKRLVLSDDADSNFVRQIYPDKTGNLWLATRGGLFRYEIESGAHQSFRHDPNSPNSLSDNFVRAVHEDRQGQLWIGTFNGLDRYDKKTGIFTHFRHDVNQLSSLSNNRITFLTQDRRGVFWVGTGAGLNRMEIASDGSVSFHRYIMRRNKEGPIYAMLEGRDGQLWISTDTGISRFDRLTGRFHHYFARDGMAEGAYVIGAAYAAGDGSFYFGSEAGGLTAFRPEAIHTNPFPPQIAITSLRINDTPIKPGQAFDGFTLKEAMYQAKSLELSHRHAVFSLEFAALHYSDPNSNRYAYQLQGFDKAWISADAKTRRATYTNLAPGEYTFRVRAANKDGVWNETGSSLRIRILQVFWKTWWFLSLSAALLLGSGYSAYRSRIRGFTRQKRLLEEQVAIRTAEVIQQKQIVEQKNALVERQKYEAELKNELLEQQKYEVERQKENVELAHHNISVLSEIGRDITSTLDRDAIMCNVYRHIQGLLDATSFVIYLMDEDKQSLSIAFRIETGQLKLPYKVWLSDLSDNAARSVREEREIVIDLNREDADQRDFEQHETSFDNLPLLSQIYAPLATGNRVLGVMSILSRLEHAYGAREQLIFRTLCAYVAIALDNAAAYRQLEATLQTLRATQAQLVQQEKMASLGTLTAGVAHEINNPANFAHVGAQALASDLERFRHFLIDLAGEDAEPEVMASLNQRLDHLSDQVGTIIEGTTRIKNLVLDLRTFSRLDQATKKTVAIADSLMSTINLVRTQYAQTAEIRCDLAANPVLDCFPAELNQVFMNLIVNACQAIQAKLRKLGSKERGCLTIRSRLEQECLVIEFEDNGDGIPQTIIDHIFEPFFTTKSVGEGTGLGLSISFGIIEKHHGNIAVSSREGHGTCFTLTLPLAQSISS